jgi:molecular chaperone GrpE
MKQNPKSNKSKPKTVEQYEQQIGELTLALQRLQAEFENYKKREAAAKAELMDSAKELVLNELLPALDNFDLAAAHLPEDLQGNAWAQGMQYVGQQLTQKLEEMDIQKLNPSGEKFDHHTHEAVEYVQSDKPEGIITDVITPGYQIGEKIVRHARVKVSSGPNKATSKPNK